MRLESMVLAENVQQHGKKLSTNYFIKGSLIFLLQNTVDRLLAKLAPPAFATHNISSPTCWVYFVLPVLVWTQQRDKVLQLVLIEEQTSEIGSMQTPA